MLMHQGYRILFHGDRKKLQIDKCRHQFLFVLIILRYLGTVVAFDLSVGRHRLQQVSPVAN